MNFISPHHLRFIYLTVRARKKYPVYWFIRQMRSKAEMSEAKDDSQELHQVYHVDYKALPFNDFPGALGGNYVTSEAAGI